MPVNSLGYKQNSHPIAQSFFVDTLDGIYVTKIDVYYASRDTDFSTNLHLRPIVNGYPSDVEIIPGSYVTIAGNSVSTSSDASTATSYIFDEPVYLKGLTDYAIVVSANSPNYNIYVAETNEFLLGSTEKRVTKQPSLGSLFYSQNGVTFTASQNEDLVFKVHKAKFKHSTGDIKLYNAAVPKKRLTLDPIVVDSGSSTVLVNHFNHGLQVGETVNISGIDSAGVGGISYSSLSGNRNVVAVDWRGFSFTADSAATSTVKGGGSNVLCTKNIPFSVIYPNLQTLIPNNSSLVAGIKATTGKSFAGSETALAKTSEYSGVSLNANNSLRNPYVITNSVSESFEMLVKVGTASTDVAPMVDLQRSSVTAINYIIDNQDSAATSGYNVPIRFTSETTPRGGTSASKHVTRIITLSEDAVGLKVILGANRPSVASFDVYYRVATGDELISDKNWVLASQEFSVPADENPTVFRDYKYLIGGQGGNIPAFNQFQIKIVLNSQSAARVPVIKDLRAIALSV